MSEHDLVRRRVTPLFGARKRKKAVTAGSE